MPHVVVVGGGISGLAAALAVRSTAPPGTRVTVVEQSDRLGGKLRTGDLGEEGAETFLVRAPEVVALARTVGLDVVHPAVASASLLVDGALRPLPGGTLLGVPADPDAVEAAGVLPSDAVARLRAEPGTAGPGPLLGEDDVSVGALVRPRLGDAVVERLVDPLLGGVYAGRADALSVEVTVPTLAAAAREHGSLVEAARAARPAASAGPVFGTVPGGLSRLVDAVAAATGAEIRLGLPVRELRRTGSGWQLVVGSARNPELLEADAVVLAVPAAPAARLLGGVSPAAAAEVGVLEYASVGLVTLALADTELPAGSGLLVPASEGLTVKAVTFLSQKWGTAGPLELVRASVGRYGEETVLQRSDEDLAAVVRDDVGRILGRPVTPVETRVRRWGGALPQYAPGHLDRIRRARARLSTEGTLALAGAAYDGVGLPACVRSGTAAGTRVGCALQNRAESGNG
jgi:oxygen-dependent protoporphyrinogen oxidase